MERQLLQCVNNSIDLGLYENARFLAERLVAACPTEVQAAGSNCAGAICLPSSVY